MPIIGSSLSITSREASGKLQGDGPTFAGPLEEEGIWRRYGRETLDAVDTNAAGVELWAGATVGRVEMAERGCLEGGWFVAVKGREVHVEVVLRPLDVPDLEDCVGNGRKAMMESVVTPKVQNWGGQDRRGPALGEANLKESFHMEAQNSRVCSKTTVK